MEFSHLSFSLQPSEHYITLQVETSWAIELSPGLLRDTFTQWLLFCCIGDIASQCGFKGYFKLQCECRSF